MADSEWMCGLLHAEEIGVEEAVFNVNRNEYDYPSEFLNGVLDYIHHTSNRLNNEPRN